MATLVIEKIKNVRTNSNFVGIFPIPGGNGAYYYKLKPDMTIDKIPSSALPDVEINTVLRVKFYDGITAHELNYLPERDEAFLKILLMSPDILGANDVEESKPTAQFRVYIKEERNKQISQEVINRSKTITKAATMNDDQLRNVCFFFRLPAQSWTRDEMIIALVGEGGQLFMKPVVNGKTEDRMEMFLSENFSTDIDFEIRTAVNKGIEMSLIVYRGDMYYYGEKGIGATTEHVVLYFKSNIESYENGLKKSIEGTFEKENEKEPGLSALERVALEEEAKRYGIKGDVRKFKDETLVLKVTEARAGSN
jgi:hypothetical protein